MRQLIVIVILCALNYSESAILKGKKNFQRIERQASQVNAAPASSLSNAAPAAPIMVTSNQAVPPATAASPQPQLLPNNIPSAPVSANSNQAGFVPNAAVPSAPVAISSNQAVPPVTAASPQPQLLPNNIPPAPVTVNSNQAGLVPNAVPPAPVPISPPVPVTISSPQAMLLPNAVPSAPPTVSSGQAVFVPNTVQAALATISSPQAELQSTTESSESESESGSGEENSSEEEAYDEYSCYHTCREQTTEVPITIDSDLKFHSAVQLTDLTRACQMYQSEKSCVDACPSSFKTNRYNELYKRISFICVEHLPEASKYFTCTYNDNRKYENECTTNQLAATTLQSTDQPIDLDVTIYCRKQRCMMRAKLATVQQTCGADVVQFAKNYYTVDVDTTEKGQEFGALWTTECVNLQNVLRSNLPL